MFCYDEYTSEHRSKNCPSRKTCKTCNGSHPTSLHNPLKVKTIHAGGIESPVNMCIVPVKLKHQNSSSEIVVHTMLDTCSQGTFISTEVLKTLGVKPYERETIITVKTMNGETTKKCVAIKGLTVEAVQPHRSKHNCREIKVEPPFTFCGVDLFGPFYTKQGRKEFKRYGALFTCFSLRAVHIEMTNNLDAESNLSARKDAPVIQPLLFSNY